MAMTATADFSITASSSDKSLVRRIFDRLIEARMIEAKRVAIRELLKLDDATIQTAGFTRSQLVAGKI